MTQNMAQTLAAKVRIRWGVKIALRDGIRLNATLYLPIDLETPVPALFTLTPYVAQTYHDRGLYFAAHGYPFLTIDARGRGNSEGEFRPFIQEGQDGFDIVEWLAQQSYCDGRVAMWGGSYGGYNQWTAAAEHPPHLATIVPVAAPHISTDFPHRNNIAPSYLIQWLTLVSGRTAQDKIFENKDLFWSSQFRRWFESGAPFNSLDTAVGNPSHIFQEWIAHPKLDAYWDRYNPTAEAYAKLALSVLTITGSYDSDQLGALAHYRNHLRYAPPEVSARHYLIIGPWDHSGTRNPQAEFCGIKVGPASLIDLPALHLEWYAWTLRGGAKPAFLRKNVAYYVMGAEKWRYADTLDGITAYVQPLYLTSTAGANDVFHSGALARTKPTPSDPDCYVDDPRNVHHAALESTVDTENVLEQRMIFSGTSKLIYHGPPLEEDTEVSGFFRLSVWLGIDQPDADVCASIYEIDIEGRSILLSTDWLRARYRESLREEKLIDSKDPLRYDLERFMFISRRLARGSRLRLVIGPVSSIYAERNYHTGGIVSEESITDARPVTVKLFHDEAHPSVLYVPIGHAETGVKEADG